MIIIDIYVFYLWLSEVIIIEVGIVLGVFYFVVIWIMGS